MESDIARANRFFKKAWENAKANADTYDREWVASHPGLDSGFMANHWRAAEQHIQMCWSGFKADSEEGDKNG